MPRGPPWQNVHNVALWTAATNNPANNWVFIHAHRPAILRDRTAGAMQKQFQRLKTAGWQPILPVVPPVTTPVQAPPLAVAQTPIVAATAVTASVQVAAPTAPLQQPQPEEGGVEPENFNDENDREAQEDGGAVPGASLGEETIPNDPEQQSPHDSSSEEISKREPQSIDKNVKKRALEYGDSSETEMPSKRAKTKHDKDDGPLVNPKNSVQSTGHVSYRVSKRKRASPKDDAEDKVQDVVAKTSHPNKKVRFLVESSSPQASSPDHANSDSTTNPNPKTRTQPPPPPTTIRPSKITSATDLVTKFPSNIRTFQYPPHITDLPSISRSDFSADMTAMGITERQNPKTGRKYLGPPPPPRPPLPENSMSVRVMGVLPSLEKAIKDGIWDRAIYVDRTGEVSEDGMSQYDRRGCCSVGVERGLRGSSLPSSLPLPLSLSAERCLPSALPTRSWIRFPCFHPECHEEDNTRTSCLHQ